MSWRDIKSAPKVADMPILVWDGAFITVAHWSNGRWWVHNSYGFNEDGEITHVTHWMPLPLPPEGK